jgi:hypothetical protein
MDTRRQGRKPGYKMATIKEILIAIAIVALIWLGILACFEKYY